MKNLYIYLVLLIVVASSCSSNDSEIKPNEKGTLTLHFDNVVGDKDLTLTSGVYTNSSSESFSVTTLKYFISNIKLKTTDNKEFVVPQDSSYFLVDESVEESQDLLLKDIPAADYNEVTFTIGVDSARSVSDVSKRKGVLDPAETDMYWSWNSGYIFFKMEGTSTAIDDSFYYHIGGYGGYSSDAKTFNNIKTISIQFGGDKATVRSTIEPETHFYVDVLKVFNGETTLSIKDHPMVMFSDYSVNIATSYASIIEYGHVHNDPKK